MPSQLCGIEVDSDRIGKAMDRAVETREALGDQVLLLVVLQRAAVAEAAGDRRPIHQGRPVVPEVRDVRQGIGSNSWRECVTTISSKKPSILGIGGTELCKKNTISTEAAFAVAVTHASLSEGKTGRGVTASRERIAIRAGVSVSVVKRARRVLGALGMAVEQERGRYLTTFESMAAEAHHGHRQFRAASVWALMSPRGAVTTITAPVKKSRKPSRATLRTAAHRARTASRTSPHPSGRGPYPPLGDLFFNLLL